MDNSWIIIYDSPVGGTRLNRNGIRRSQIVYFDVSNVPEGYVFIGWEDTNGNRLGSDVIQLVDGGRYRTNHACDYEFVAILGEGLPEVCLVDVDCDDMMGRVTVSEGNDVCGNNVTITAEPNCCNEFVSWSDVGPDRSEANRTVPVLQGENIYTAIFREKDFEFSVGVNDGTMGHVDIENETHIVHCQDTITFEAKPNVGYRFVRWEPDGETNPVRTITYNCSTPYYKAIFEEINQNVISLVI